jgi:tetratricopeptide (TPR) repeat protein
MESVLVAENWMLSAHTDVLCVCMARMRAIYDYANVGYHVEEKVCSVPADHPGGTAVMPEAPQVGEVVRAAQAALWRGEVTRARLLMYVAFGMRGQTPTLDDYLRMGDVLTSVYEPARALSVSLYALALEPENLHARYNMASAWMKVGDYTRALALCEEALQEAPRDIDFLNQMASALRLLQRYEESLTVLGVVIALAPKDAVAWFNVSLVLLKLERHSDVLEAAGQASILQPTRPDPWVVQGRAYEALGDDVTAEQDYHEALCRKRCYSQAITGLQRIRTRQGRHWATLRLRVLGHSLQWFAKWRRQSLLRYYRTARKRMEQEITTANRMSPS